MLGVATICPCFSLPDRLCTDMPGVESAFDDIKSVSTTVGGEALDACLME
ncbi:MAG: hypothetical protein LBU32_10440 [Clostridiales bacterium]|nr:hypothetical protein [Clostridiales bacterium]